MRKIFRLHGVKSPYLRGGNSDHRRNKWKKRKEYELQTQRLHTSPWISRIQNTINNMRKELSQLVEIQRDNRKPTNKTKPNCFKNTT